MATFSQSIFIGILILPLWAYSMQDLSSLSSDDLALELGKAAHRGDLTVFKHILTYNPSLMHTYGPDHESLLQYAITSQMQAPEIVAELLEKKVDVNKKHSDQTTPLLKSIFLHQPRIALSLLEKGADYSPKIKINKFEFDAYKLAKMFDLTLIASRIEELQKTTPKYE